MVRPRKVSTVVANFASRAVTIAVKGEHRTFNHAEELAAIADGKCSEIANEDCKCRCDAVARSQSGASALKGNHAMIRKIPDDVQAAIDAKVASGTYADEETVLREALASLDEFDEDVAKLKTAIDDWQSGDVGMPIDQAVDLIRGKVEGSDE